MKTVRSRAGRGGEEVEVLPDGATHGAGYSNEVMEAAQARLNGGPDEGGEDLHAGPGSDALGVQEVDSTHRALDHQAPKPPVAHEDVRAPAQEKGGNSELSGPGENGHELLGGGGPEEEVGGTPDPEGGEGRQGDPDLDRIGTQVGLQRLLPAHLRCSGHRRSKYGSEDPVGRVARPPLDIDRRAQDWVHCRLSRHEVADSIPTSATFCISWP